MRFTAALSFLLLAAASGADASLISTSSARLPMSLSSVINDLEAEDVSSVKSACLITSRGVTTKTKSALLKRVFGIEDDDTLTAFGTDSGLIVALGPKHPAEVASTVVACQGRIVFYPDSIDLSRGEGLFDTLGPAMEKLMAAGMKGTLLVVSDDPETCQKQLQSAATVVLQHLVQPKGSSIQTLQEIFNVQYVSLSVDLEAVLGDIPGATTPDIAAASVAATVDFGTVFSPPSIPALSHKDLAAARQLGPAARSALEAAIATVQRMAAETTFLAQFGNLCDATVQRALQDLPTSATAQGSKVAQQIQAQLRDELYAELGDECDKQLAVLKEAYFDACKEGLSNLRISPTLEADSQEVATKTIKDFTVAAKQMIAKGSNWSIIPAKTSLSHALTDYVSARMTAAKASGKYKPLPRKGVTVGMHWLLPKPFGNDFRQEPWMMHATDNLVYVPKDKITNVNPEDVTAGDWRSKIVPSPASREMVYMQ